MALGHFVYSDNNTKETVTALGGRATVGSLEISKSSKVSVVAKDVQFLLL
jgi:hypothetical protein